MGLPKGVHIVSFRLVGEKAHRKKGERKRGVLEESVNLQWLCDYRRKHNIEGDIELVREYRSLFDD